MLVPGADAEARVADAARGARSRARAFRAGPSRARAGCSSAGRRQPTAALLDRRRRDGWPLVLTGAPDPAEAPLVAAIKAATRARRSSISPASSRSPSSRADRRRAPVHRLRHGADAHGRRAGHAGRRAGSARATRPNGGRGGCRIASSRRRVIRAGPAATTAAAAATIPTACSRCRRRACRGGRRAARRDRDRPRPMRLGIVRQRYTPFGGAERFVERAIDALVARGVHVRVYTRRWPQDGRGRIEPVICNPFYRRQPLARRELRARGARRARARPSRPRADARAHRRLRHLPRRRRRASRVARRAPARRRPRASGSRIAANPYHRYMLAAEARVFADPSLKAVICISQMVRDDIRRALSRCPTKSCT